MATAPTRPGPGGDRKSVQALLASRKAAALKAAALKARATPGRTTHRRTLTPQERVFIREYLATSNASEAARRAGYAPGSACVTGNRLLKRAVVRQALAVALEARPLVRDALKVVEDVATIATAGAAERTQDRLRAYDLLGKYHAIWTDVQVVRELPRDPQRLRELIAVELVRIFGPDGLQRLADQARDLAQRGALPAPAAASTPLDVVDVTPTSSAAQPKPL